MNDQEHKCQCDFRIRMLGDGCRYCHPQKYIDRLYDTMDGMIHSIIVKLNGAGYYEAATMLRQQQDLLGGYHEQALNDSRATSKLVAEMQAEIEALKVKNQALKIMNDGKNKIIEEYEHKYPDFFFAEHDLMGKR